MADSDRQKIYNELITGQCNKDIIVLDHVHSMPYMNVEYHSKYFFIGICLNGRLRGKYDFRDVDLTAGDICWTLPNHVISHTYVSDDYDLMAVFISRECFNNLKVERKVGKYGYLTTITSIKPPQQIFDIVHNAFKLLKALTDTDNPRYNEAAASSAIEIISNVIDDYITENVPNISHRKGSHELLFERFYDAVVEHYRESREIMYYARLMCRSPKYFAAVIKATSGITATEWINRYVIIKAKWALIHDRHKSIQQISNELGFTEQASFSRMFKNMEGITPSAYRAKNS